MTETTGSTATPESGNPDGADAAAVTEDGKLSRRDRKRGGKRGKKGLFARIALFYRQIIAELRKVVWPTRGELLQYTSVVVIFVVVLMLLVFGLDYAFGKLSFQIFG
ncbi:preprotein translocase subunit SecE [Kitasatospora camelliae]|uniref:Protein translocase subunit SecE n=1 Tax=Kitasatospora camelliae TaxID=3156397 RepID=A0AAU8JUX7_9ACTN